MLHMKWKAHRSSKANICRCSVLTRAHWCCTPPATTARHVWLWTMILDSKAPPPARSDWLLYCAWVRLLGIARWWLHRLNVCHRLWSPPPTCTSWTPLIGRGVHGNRRLLDTSQQRWKMTDFIFRIKIKMFIRSFFSHLWYALSYEILINLLLLSSEFSI